jgi:predicted aldo/keto reductase-like oxidoreductase
MIQERLIKSTNTKIPALGFGAMRLPTIDNKIDYEKASKLVNYAIDNGIYFIDTAYNFHNGESEIFLRSILKERRNDILISTKLPIWYTDSEFDFNKYFEIQLEKLGVDYIDFYFLHSLNATSFKKLNNNNILQFLDKIKKEGKVRNIGFSYHGPYTEFIKLVDTYKWDVCMLQHNFLDNQKLGGNIAIDYAAKKGIGIIAMQPLKGGILSKDTPLEVEEILEKNDIEESPSNWAFKWLLNNPNISCVLSGMTTIDEVNENIESIDEFLPNTIHKTELELYKKVRDIYNKTIKIQCTNCGHCLPCPLNVDIPTCFLTYNKKKIFQTGIKEYIKKTTGVTNNSFASLCIECGACISKCPQNINIPEELKKVQKDMEFPGFKHILKVINKLNTQITISDDDTT